MQQVFRTDGLLPATRARDVTSLHTFGNHVCRYFARPYLFINEDAFANTATTALLILGLATARASAIKTSNIEYSIVETPFVLFFSRISICFLLERSSASCRLLYTFIAQSVSWFDCAVRND